MRTLWAGTNSGAIFVYAVHCAAGDKRSTAPVTWQPGESGPLSRGDRAGLLPAHSRTAVPRPPVVTARSPQVRSSLW